jgi:hypothetical protein
MKFMDNFKNLLFIFQVMFYYLMESAIISIFTTIIWKYFILSIIHVDITYIQWVAIIWIIKVVFFDVFKLISGLTTMKNSQETIKEE